MQGAGTTPPAPAADTPDTQTNLISTASSEVKTENENMRLHQPGINFRKISIDSDNQSDKSDEEFFRNKRKRTASPCGSPLPLEKRIAKYECQQCQQRFDCANSFEMHRYTMHGVNSKISLYSRTHHEPKCIDFSKKTSERAVEVKQNNHNDVTIKDQYFRCEICTKNFTTIPALEIHKKTCTTLKVNRSPNRDPREDFFAKLDLRTCSFVASDPLTPPLDSFTSKYDDTNFKLNGIRHIDATRDFADIQSILNVTSAGSILERLAGSRTALENTVLTPPDTIKKDREIEETQDNFAAEFRRMKLRGEFPCRLCPAKFPNLRALKGHNRVHLSGTGPGPYQCNMCPHASLDKAALVRHMRTHNGDRPYECAVCNYAFTTKANCERHLRNRHAKVTREDVKRSIIYHPSEDPNNDEVNSKIVREEVKRSLAFHTPEPEIRNESTDRDTPLSHFTPAYIAGRRSIPPLTHSNPEIANVTKEAEQVVPRIKVKGINQLTEVSDFRPLELTFRSNGISSDTYDDSPVDLSTNDSNNDVLDLSKKKRDVDNDDIQTKVTLSSPPEPDAAAIAASAFEKTRLLLAHQRLFENSLPKLDTAYYATQLSQLYSGAIPSLGGITLPPTFPINPYFLQPAFFPHPSDPQELVEMKQRIQKEIIRGLSMSGGGIVNDEPEPQTKVEFEDEQKYNFKDKVVSPSPAASLSESPQPIHNTIQNDPVKMVIKNGVLMPKQKQRRYRTERPFSCSQCSARFTLRSNMERHVKQQHPQHWSIKRPSSRHLPYSTSDSLTERMKYALLSHHLERPSTQLDGSPVRRDSDEVADNEEDEEDTLIIDEESENENKHIENPAAHRIAAEILLASRQHELQKDFETKIAGNLINKPVCDNDKNESVINTTSNQEQNNLPLVPVRSDEEEDEEGLVASTSEENNSGSDENKSESDVGLQPTKKRSAYSLAPNRVSCPYCNRKFPWSSSLRRHVLTHTGQKPFKCPHCPLLFTTKSNCDRHFLRKHGGNSKIISDEPASEATQSPLSVNDTRPGIERPIKCASCPTSTFNSLESLKNHMSSRHTNGDSSNAPHADVEESNEAGLSYKCHLCDASFKDRSSALGHLAASHSSEYEQLVNKGALEATSDRSESADDDDRGKFPDHVNRKVVCAFCVRRFWSAEDLRRHMRTHSGERPFICELCSRRFTLKHSMLRHRKKHREDASDDEDLQPLSSPTKRERDDSINCENEDGSGSEIPSNVNNNNSPPAPQYDKLQLKMARKHSSEIETETENGGDLIGKLLGIQDKTIINKLLSSADEAAKFFGVNK